MSGEHPVKATGARVKLTYDDFLLFPDDGQRHELIGGEHYVTPSPNLTHQQILGNLFFLLRSYLEQKPIGRAFLSPLDVVFSNFDVVEPDLLYVSRERAPEILTVKHVAGAPDLVVEIGSPSTRRRDETIKRELYERWNVSEYWVVDTKTDVLRVYRQTSSGFDRPTELSRERGEVLTSPLFPGLRLSLSDVFRD